MGLLLEPKQCGPRLFTDASGQFGEKVFITGTWVDF